MPESRRRKPKRPKKQQPGAKIKVIRGVKHLRMRDEYGNKIWSPLPKNDKE